MILRGGKAPNYDAVRVAAACKELEAAQLPATLMVDCSHANSGKDPFRQRDVWKSILAQRQGGRREIIGAMIESHIHAGSQPLVAAPSELKYGVSITDACLDWESTENLLRA